MEDIFVGIDLGGTNIQGASGTPHGNIIQRGKIPTQAALGAETVIDDIAQLIFDLAQGREIKAVGMGVPGLLDLEKGVCVFSGNLNWRDIPVVSLLSAKVGAPVFMDNDVRVAALGELAQGKARDCQDFIYLTVGTGIGSGIFIAGELLRGSHGVAGEVGHMVLDPQGPACTCGSRGCLEALASATAIAREGRAAAASSPESLLNQLATNPQDIDAALVFQAAGQGDATATQVVDTAMNWLGVGIASLVNIFNPRLVVIGGGVALAGEKLLAPVRNQVGKYGMQVQKETVEIVTSALADSAGVEGGLELCRRQSQIYSNNK